MAWISKCRKVMWILICIFPFIAHVISQFPPATKSGSMWNLLYHSDIRTVPEVGTCGAPGADNAFILQSDFEFGQSSDLFRSGEVLHCAYDCARQRPRPEGTLTQVIPEDEGMPLGFPGCTDPQNTTSQGLRLCYVDTGVVPTSSATYSLWVKPEPSASGTLLDSGSLRVRLTTRGHGDDGDLAIYVGHRGDKLASLRVVDPVSKWLFVAIQENLHKVDISSLLPAQGTFTIFLNESMTTETAILGEVDGFNGPTLRIGASLLSDTDQLYALFRDVRRYSTVLTNREVAEIRTGDFAEVLPLTNCLCSDSYPRIDTTKSSVHCWSNTDNSAARIWRLEPETNDGKTMFFLPEFVIDGTGQYQFDLPLFWVSSPGLENVALEMDLSGPAEIASISIQLVSEPPEGALVFEKYLDGSWTPWHYMSFDCPALGFSSGFKPADDLWMPDPFGAACQNITKIWQEGWHDDSFGGIRHPPVITWEVMEGRPGQVATWRHADLTRFIRTEGIRVRFQGHARGTSNSRRRQVHAVAEVQALGQMIVDAAAGPFCECFPDTTMTSACDVSGECACDPALGVPDVAGVQCAPYITSVSSDYGPVSGGTDIYLYGGYLGSQDNPRVIIGNSECKFNMANDTMIWCNTPSVKDSRPVPSGPQPINVQIPMRDSTDIYRFQIEPTFTIKPDPIVTAIDPLGTFIRGGVVLTIHGFHLDSVEKPMLQIIMTYRGRTYPQPLSVCSHLEDTRLLCPTPWISLPDEYADLDVIQDANDVTTYTVRKRSVGNESPVFASAERSSLDKRSTNVMGFTAYDGVISNANLQFSPSLHFDGLMTYRDLTQSLPSYADMKLFGNPILYNFNETPRKFDPQKEKLFKINGRHMLGQGWLHTYEVRIGGVPCVPLQLSGGELQCEPPDEQPEMMSPEGAEWQGSAVVVRIGPNIERHIGYVFYHVAGVWDDPAVRLGVILGCCLFLILILVIIFIICNRKHGWISCPPGGDKERGGPHEMINLTDMVDGGRDPNQSNTYTPLPTKPRKQKRESRKQKRESRKQKRDNRDMVLQMLDPELRASILECLIDSSLIQLIKEVGKGHFGRVYAGVLRSADPAGSPTLVAIKTLKDDAFSVSAISEFLGEATIMKDFDHKNVLRLIGVSIEETFVYVALPFMEHGDLRTFISKPEQQLTVRELLDFGLQAARGMAYLERQKFVHRDVAARNCMVDASLCVKVADFGLARDMYEKDYYRPEDLTRPLPVKWTALECLDGAEFTTKSDVWSFGVLLWEILTRGRKPYNDVSNFDMKRYLVSGRRLDPPEFCPSRIYDLMKRCWHPNAEKRPSFEETVTELDSVLHPPGNPGDDDKRRGIHVDDDSAARPESRLSAVPDATPSRDRGSGYSQVGSSNTPESPVAQRALHGASGYSPGGRKSPYKPVTSPLVHDTTGQNGLTSNSDKPPLLKKSPRLEEKLANQNQDSVQDTDNNNLDRETVYANDPLSRLVAYEPTGLMTQAGGMDSNV